jgi:HAD superfamily hydrolase (TIGR01509 family)
MPAIIFDLDGTLVDTLPVYLAAYEKVLRKNLKENPDKRIISEKFGKCATDIMVGILDEMGIDPKPERVEDLILQIRDEFSSQIRELILLPNVPGILEGLKGMARIGLATSSRRYAAEGVLKKFDMEKYFDAVVTGEDVTRSKPAPDIFLEAARRLGVEPEDCIVVEDAAHGISGTKAAGMFALAVKTGMASEEELLDAGADLVIRDLMDFDYDILN